MPKELKLHFEKPENIYIFDSGDETSESLIVKKLWVEEEYQAFSAEGIVLYWNCTDACEVEYNVPVTGLGENYWLTREDAEAKLKGREYRSEA